MHGLKPLLVIVFFYQQQNKHFTNRTNTSFDLYRDVKMGWNPRVNPAHYGFGSGWVEIFFTYFNTC